MSEGDHRLRLVAIGFAGVAMVVAIGAAIVVVKRGHHEPAKAPEQPALAPIIDRNVLASDVVRLQFNAIEPVVENGRPIGVHVKDETLARALGLEPDDVLTSLSGRSLTRDMDIDSVVFNVSMMRSTEMYVEITRGGAQTLLRWKLDGDLGEARFASLGTVGGLYGSGYTPSPPAPPDPMLDTIEKIDGTRVEMPRKTAEHIFGNPVATMKGARVVPAVKNGQPGGIKLYAIRPSSVFAKLGFLNGDTIEQINGVAITSPDKALEVYTKLHGVSNVDIDIIRRGNPMQLHIKITK